MAKKKLSPLEDPPAVSSANEEEAQISSGEEEAVEEQTSVEEPSSPLNDKTQRDAAKPKAKEVRGSPAMKSGKKRSVKPKEKETTVKSGKKRMGGEASTDMHARKVQKVSREGKKQMSAPERSSDSESAAEQELNHSEPEVKKVSLFQRVWSEEDEICLLQGMIDFQADTGESPYADMDRFYESVVKSLSFEASKTRFVEKIRSLKRKYVEKGKNSYAKPHDNKCLQLANVIWGSDGLALVSAVKPNLRAKKSVKPIAKEEVSGEQDGQEAEGERAEDEKDWLDESFVLRSFAGLGVDEHFVKGRWSMVAVETKKILEDKLKLMQAKETELMLLKTDFMHELSTIIAETS